MRKILPVIAATFIAAAAPSVASAQGATETEATQQQEDDEFPWDLLGLLGLAGLLGLKRDHHGDNRPR